MEQLGLDHEHSALSAVEFVVLDTETTGASPALATLTEVAALRVRGGRVIGHFRSLVAGPDPIPPRIVALTGITDAMRRAAPAEEVVMARLHAFAEGAVPVGHNLRFDLGFLDAAMARSGFPPLERGLDTLRLARRLLAGEVRNFKLATLARAFGLPPPTHRAYADVATTRALLDLLIGRAGSLGITTLPALTTLEPPTSALTTLLARVPRRPGLYYLLGHGGVVLYVGQSDNVHQRLATYLGGDGRRKVPRLVALTETVRVSPIACSLVRRLTELAEIRRLRPRFNTEYCRRSPSLTVGLPDETRLGPLTLAQRSRLVALVEEGATTHTALVTSVSEHMREAATKGRFEEAEALRRLGLRLTRLAAVTAATADCADVVACRCADGAHRLRPDLFPEDLAPFGEEWYWAWSIMLDELGDEPSLARARTLLERTRHFLPRRGERLEEVSRSA